MQEDIKATYVRNLATQETGLLLDTGHYWAKVRYPSGKRHSPIHKLEEIDESDATPPTRG
jgi:hypothetical protein